MQKLNNTFIGMRLSWGTLQTEDLIKSFMDFLQYQKNKLDIAARVDNIKSELSATHRLNDFNEYQDERSQILNEDIINLLNDIAPDGSYFGASEGDGSDFGFWPNSEEDF